MSFRGVVAVVVAVALLGGCAGDRGHGSASGGSTEATSSALGSGASSTTTRPKAESRPPPLAPLLLSAKDLGDGWRDLASAILDPATAALLRLCGRDVALGGSSVVALSQPKERNLVAHLVARFDSREQAEQAVQAVAQAGISCGQWDFEGAHIKINPVEYALVGDGRIAFRMIIDGTKAKSNADYFVWYRGRYVEAVLNRASVLLDPKITKRAISAADRRLVAKG